MENGVAIEQSRASRTQAGAPAGGGGQSGGSGPSGRAWQQQGGRQHAGNDRKGGDRRGSGGGGGPPPMLRDGRDGRGGRGSFGPAASSRSPRAGRWDALDVAASNAPQRLLQLVGDPRSGVADDTAASAFGEVTVELLHHQPSNEVYWYKYAFAGGQPGGRGGHRDGRLSDYSRNLAYIMRAKDPARWSVEALADKFRVRRQRMLAALALKELEAQRLEAGALLRGPLSAYSLRVALADVALDKASGAPRLRPASAPAAASRGVLLGRMLPRVVSATQRTQAALLSALRPHGFDVTALRAALLADVAAVEAAAAELDAAAAGAGGEGGEGGKAAGVLGYLAPELAACRAAVEAVAAAVEAVVNASPLLQEERQAAALRAKVEAALRAGAGKAPQQPAAAAAAAAAAVAATGAGGDADGGSKAAAPAAAAAGDSEGLEALLQPLTQDGAGAPLQRFLFSLPPPTRATLLSQLPRLAAQLAAAGVDLERAGRDAAYRGPLAAAAGAAPTGGKQRQRQGGAAGAASSKLPRLTVDVLGFVPVSEAAAEALAAAVESAAGAEAALVAKMEALQVAGGEGTAAAAKGGEVALPTAPSAAELRDARALLRQYSSAHSMWGDLRAAARTAAGHSPDTKSKRRKMEVMEEADPSALMRALQVEAHTQLRRGRDRAAADSLKASLSAAAAAEAAAGSDGAKPPPTPLSDPAGWDALAAWLDVAVAGRVYARGSGERHVVRLPTYPAFEGYPLSELDRAAEGELGALNRLVAARTEAAQWAAFRRDLLFNLGVRGEKLRDSAPPGAPAWPANLRSELSRPVVVYGIGADGATQYPPLYVAAGDGAKRPLNEQEKVHQERRLPGPRLPYFMGRIRTLPELN
ncbi:hypothetical protein HXX76_011060 [Chlamydomonas incerta]|uniref:Uncharacterized protein n=1 Tax=Chlamydomonas incerta TaxID=51695 RepID=A0A835SLC2_CHLIN|nr:hypothetical protein HXX76_011060 [Chlamydomonas incerta]|eukprot:KAG2429292.1 hypothetical protein HXX76_011060 [Chlamydomonas incerta]